ncbi:hypothetical protein [Cellulophaga sp. Z1A5H]|uniref:hypothetical protein n=1 Tax=Cellulophaga sp. Z1A5H TaxID=2687291 RepID=UPI0013FDEA96|nr:hypothetical protein [Cellulophaga sp. Z1A5H]
MKKITISIILISVLVTSCHAQNKIDLLDIKLPVNKDILLNESYKTREYDIYPDYNTYKSSDPNLLIVNNEKISNGLQEKQGPKTNDVLFYLKNKDQQITSITLKTFDTEKTKLLHKALLDKFNKPNYFNSKSFASYSIWENKLTNNLYLFEHNYGPSSNVDNKEKGILYSIDMNDQILVKKFTNAAYSYYKEYLNQRKIDGKDYSYEEFAKKKDEDGTSSYLKAISNPVKH